MRKFLLKLLMGASLTTSVFIFQACYGTPVPDSEVPRNQTRLQEQVQEDPVVPEDEVVPIEEAETVAED